MKITIIDKKCTIDYLTELIPLQKKMFRDLVDGGLMDIEGQVKSINCVLKIIDGAKEVYNYDSILKVLNHWIDSGRGYVRLDQLQKELKKSLFA